MLKKQTVWLLTMLSLMIVLSVYYMSSPNGEDLAFINDENLEDKTATTELGTGDIGLDGDVETEDVTDAEGEVTPSASTDELFTTIRMQINDERSARMEMLEEEFASSSSSTEEKEQVYDEIEQIKSVTNKEAYLEETLKAENGYQDVLVRSKDDSIEVTVKVDELSGTEANNIMQMTKDEFGEMNVEVKFQPVS